jgi:hypothetical protein
LALGSRDHLDSIALVDKGDGGMLGNLQELRVVVLNHIIRFSAEHDTIKVDALCFSRSPGFGMLASSHGKEGRMLR